MTRMELVYNFPENEYFDNSKQRFITLPPIKLHFEHSLYTISLWESITKKPFFPKDDKDVMSNEQLLIYLKCSVVEELDDPNEVLFRLDEEFLDKFKEFIADTKSATWFNDNHIGGKQFGKPSKETMTSELLYYYMVALEIPFECEHWPINRLISLIRICSIKQSNDPMSKKDEAMSRSQLNKMRKAQMLNKSKLKH